MKKEKPRAPKSWLVHRSRSDDSSNAGATEAELPALAPSTAPDYNQSLFVEHRLPSCARTVRALLVYPRFPMTYWGFQYGLRLVGKKASLPPLGLISLAALFPRGWEFRLVDLNVTELDDQDIAWADVVLTGGLLIQVDSTREVIERAHASGVPVAVGGPAASTSPLLFEKADVVFRGEAEGRIEELIAALTQSRERPCILDAPKKFPEMAKVAVPRYDLLNLTQYSSLSLQYSRGCPYQCEFCDIVEIFGRESRVKSAEQVISELGCLYRLGYRGTIFFVDDNFIGNKKEVKKLLPVLRRWQQARRWPFEFYTEASVDLASEPELLEEMVNAGFSAVFVGIETPAIESLKATRKFQNLRIDLSDAVDRITDAGLEVMGGFIVGFDTDDYEVFELQEKFLRDRPIPLAMVGILTALPGTALWRRLRTEGRLRANSNGDPFTRPNFQPRMKEQALLSGYAKLLAQLYSPQAYYSRCEATVTTSKVRRSNRASTLREVGSFLRTIWFVGVLSQRRRFFWHLMAKALIHGRERIRPAVVHAVQGEHLIRYTQEHVMPRIQLALAQLESEEISEASCELRDFSAVPERTSSPPSAHTFEELLIKQRALPRVPPGQRPTPSLT